MLSHQGHTDDNHDESSIDDVQSAHSYQGEEVHQVMRITSSGGDDYDDYDEHDACMMYNVHASLFVINIKSPTHI